MEIIEDSEEAFKINVTVGFPYCNHGYVLLD